MLCVAVTISLAAPAWGQYSGFYEPAPLSAPAAPPATPVPTPQPTSRLSLTAQAPGTGSFPLTVALGATVSIRVDVAAIGPAPQTITLAAMPLDDRVGVLMPSRATLSGAGQWTTSLRVGQTEGVYQLLFVAQDPSGVAGASSAIATVRVSADNPVLIAGGSTLEPVSESVELRSRNRSWRNAVTLRKTTNPIWLNDVGNGLLNDPQYRAAVAEAVELDRKRIALLGTWPEQETFQSYAKLEPIMSRYWADGGITLAAATANEAGNVFLAWRRGAGVTVTMNESVARSLGMGAKVVKTGSVLNAVGGAMIMLDFWANMGNAETPVEAREAWYKAGYSSLDLYLSNVVAATFGAAAALPGMFTSYLLTNSYDTLIGGHKQCWFKKMVDVAAAEDFLGTDLADVRAVDKVMAAMRSPKGLRGTLLDWWETEASTWAGWMGGCGNWDLAEARGYPEAFVDRLMRSSEVTVSGTTYRPWAFYYSVSRKLVRERERAIALDTAAGLRDLEGAYLTQLHDTRYECSLRLEAGAGSGVPIPGALIVPREWDAQHGWRTDGSGAATARLRGDDLSPAGTLLMRVQVPGRGSWLFQVPASVLVEVGP